MFFVFIFLLFSQNILAVSENTPYVTPRGFGSSEALGVESRGSEAPIYQPGMIGVFKNKDHFVRDLDFPSETFISNGSTRSKLKSFGEKDLVTSRALIDLLEDAKKGTPQYLRMSSVFSLTLGQTIFVASHDHKLDAWKKDNGDLSVSYRTLGLFGSGFGIQDSHLKWGFGLFGGYQIREQFVGDIQEPNPLSQSKMYHGWYTNIGIFWELNPVLHPTLFLNIENPFINAFHSFSLEETLPIKRHINVGGRVSYDIDQDMALSIMIEKKSIEQNGPLKTGLEIKIGSLLPDEALILGQYGFSPDGISYAIGTNLSLLSFYVGGEDIDFPDSRSRQKRYMIHFKINPI